MGKREKIFISDSEICFDLNHRKNLNFNISKYDLAVEKGKKRYIGFERARKHASEIKNDALLNLPFYLEAFEKKITARGAEVLWARNSREAIGWIGKILSGNDSKLVVKSKSMISEEIGINENCKKWDVEPVETDLGEFIVQVAGEKPYHILTPAIHKSKEEIAALFEKEFGLSNNAKPEEIASFVRFRLRRIFQQADVGISGANFIVADIGGIGLTENEGNGLLTVSFPGIHIVLAGIERVIPSVKQLPFFVQWLAVHGTGQNISVYNSLLLGPKKENESDGPQKMFVILLDNGRSELFAKKEESQALKCIRCGACLNACPVYKNIGGYTYSAPYTGPVGSVITPFFRGFREYGHLSFACTLCGRCTGVCPVMIPLHELLLLNRRRKVEQYGTSFVWNLGMKAYHTFFIKRNRLDFISGNIKNKLISVKHDLMGNLKQMPVFAVKSFSQQWKANKNR